MTDALESVRMQSSRADVEERLVNGTGTTRSLQIPQNRQRLRLTRSFQRRHNSPLNNPSAVSQLARSVGSNLVLLPSVDAVAKNLVAIQLKKKVLNDEINQLQREISKCTLELEQLDSNDAGLDSNGRPQSVVTEPSSKIGISNNERSRLLASAIRTFNKDPTEGFELLTVNGMVERGNAESVALLLFSDPRFSKVAIGKFIGQKGNNDVLWAYTKLHDFVGVHLVEALRRFLSSFRLPGEGQVIDRVMQAFAEHYQSSNPSVLPNADTVHLLAYAIVLLNTSLHNKAATKSGGKMTPEEFSKMVESSLIAESKKSNDASNLRALTELLYSNSTMLQSIYYNVKKQPFKLPQEDEVDSSGANAEIFFNSDKEGWMYKLGGNFRTWKRRWFILAGCCLYYFELSTDKTPKGIIPLAVGLYVREVTDVSREHCFEISSLIPGTRIRSRKTNDGAKYTGASHSFYRLSASSYHEKLEWIYKLRCAMENVSTIDFADTSEEHYF